MRPRCMGLEWEKIVSQLFGLNPQRYAYDRKEMFRYFTKEQLLERHKNIQESIRSYNRHSEIDKSLAAKLLLAIPLVGVCLVAGVVMLALDRLGTGEKIAGLCGATSLAWFWWRERDVYKKRIEVDVLDAMIRESQT
jgi:hypothetical protein